MLERDYNETASWISLNGRKERDKATTHVVLQDIASLFTNDPTHNIDPENSSVLWFQVVNLRPVVQGATSAPFEGGPQLEPEEGQKAGPDEPEQ